MRLTLDKRNERVGYTPDGRALLRRTDGRWSTPKNGWIVSLLTAGVTHLPAFDSSAHLYGLSSLTSRKIDIDKETWPRG